MAQLSKDIYDRKAAYAGHIVALSEEKLTAAGIEEADAQAIGSFSLWRHEMHTMTPGEQLEDLLYDEAESEEGTYRYDINKIADKYKLDKLPPFIVPNVFLFESLEEQAADLGIDYIPDNEENESEIYDAYYTAWSDAQNKINADIREWFSKINKKYGTEFPATETQQLNF